MIWIAPSWPAPSLRWRVTAAFGLIAVIVTGLVAVATWRLSSGYMMSQREQSAVRQTRVNAQLVQSAVVQGSDGLADLLTGLGSEVESAVLLVDRAQWISSGNLVQPQALPATFVSEVEAGFGVRQRLELDGAPVLAVGLPLPGASATFVEIYPLRELDHTLKFISWMLIVGVGVGGLITAGLGWWATSRALRPLSRFTQVAHEVASGDLDQRLPATHDRDLAPLAEAFNSTVTRLQRRVVRDARFASDVSHELRSPVTTMINAMAVLRHRRGELSPTAARALDLLDDDLGRFERMISDLLEISLSDQGAHQPEMQPVDLHEVVRGVSRARAIPDESIFAFGSGPVVLAERRRLERAIDNVLANAEKHGQGVVRVAVWEDAARAVVEIDDRGPGVPIDARERIFERFTRIPATEATEGTGLGLALVADHIRLYSGRAWVTDAPGGGARFVIELRKAR